MLPGRQAITAGKEMPPPARERRVGRGCGVLVCLWLWLAAAGCGSSPDPPTRLEPILRQSWEFYKAAFISPAGRVIRPENDQDSISEGQAYALLRAVWSRDQETFDRVYAWTEAHLSRQARHGDHLLAWRWGRQGPGDWQVLDANSATDADLDYALALLVAEARWGRPGHGLPPYGGKARAVLQDILDRATARDDAGHLWLTPGNWATAARPLLLNPSYFAPAGYRLFARAVPDPRWEALMASTYQGVAALARQLGPQPGVGLLPDWCLLTGPGQFAPAPQYSHAFGWDAIRAPWRLALDALWFGTAASRQFLAATFLPWVAAQRQERGRLLAIYDYQGRPLVDYESPVIYAGVVAAAQAAGRPELAAWGVARILTFARQDARGTFFNRPDDYYGNNWAWLGLAVAAGWAQPH